MRHACACRRHLRGDQALDPDSIRSFWNEICSPTHIVVGLTRLDANVLVAVGMAHALGRNVLLNSQDHAPERHFRSLAKHRIHRCALETAADVDALLQGGRFVGNVGVGTGS